MKPPVSHVWMLRQRPGSLERLLSDGQLDVGKCLKLITHRARTRTRTRKCSLSPRAHVSSVFVLLCRHNCLGRINVNKVSPPPTHPLPFCPYKCQEHKCETETGGGTVGGGVFIRGETLNSDPVSAVSSHPTNICSSVCSPVQLPRPGPRTPPPCFRSPPPPLQHS